MPLLLAEVDIVSILLWAVLVVVASVYLVCFFYVIAYIFSTTYFNRKLRYTKQIISATSLMEGKPNGHEEDYWQQDKS